MKTENVIRQLLAVRAAAVAQVTQIDAALGALEESFAAPEATEPAAPNRDPKLCSHPQAQRIDTTTSGGSAPTWFCPHCRHTSEELAAANAMPPNGGS